MTNLRKIFLSFLLLSALPAMSNTDHGDHLGSFIWLCAFCTLLFMVAKILRISAAER